MRRANPNPEPTPTRPRRFTVGRMKGGTLVVVEIEWDKLLAARAERLARAPAASPEPPRAA